MIPASVKLIIDRFSENGFEAYAVGGCVRDTLLKKTPSDWDITTSAPPEKTQELFSEYRQKLNGVKHGTVGVIIKGKMYEITTYRIEGDYSDMRHPDGVAFTSKLSCDLSRRDFTVNAMAMDKRGNIIDEFDGKKDLRKKLIRCVGEPERRFNEDALRIMRGLRFASMEGFTIDDETLFWANKSAENLKLIAYERIYTELKKMLVLPNAASVMLISLPVFEVIFPTLDVTGEEWNTVCKNVERAGSNLEISLMCILEHTDIKSEMLRFKMEHQLKKRILRLSEIKTLPVSKSVKQLRRLMGKYGREEIKLLCRYNVAIGKYDRSLQYIAEQAAAMCCEIKELKISGKELYEAGLRNYKIKQALEGLLTDVINGLCENEKCALLEHAKRKYILKAKRGKKPLKSKLVNAKGGIDAK